MNLTSGAISDIMEGKTTENPVLQVLGLKKISGGGSNASDRYRVLLSDGVFSQSSAMLATQLNSLVTDGQMESNCVIKLDKYVCNPIQDRKVMILLNVTVLASASEVNKKLGDPVPYKAGAQPNIQAQNNPPVQQNTAPAKAIPPAPTTPQQNRVPMQNMNNKADGGAGKAFYGNKNQAFSVQNVPNTPGGTPTRVHPINSLTPYQNRWTIRARVSQKSNIRTWSNSRGEGKLFSMNLIDESGEIKATAFKEQVDKFYDMVELNKVYYISKGSLKTADKRYSSVANDYELTFNSETQMWLCEEETNLPTLNFNFIPINQLDSHEANAVIDVIGVVKQADDLSTVMGKQSNREIKKRDVHLVDDSQVQVRLTLWGQDAEGFSGQGNPILAVKGARLSDWNGRSLSALASSQLIMNPDVDEAHKLRGWYDSVGHSVDYSQYKSDKAGATGGHATNWRSFLEIKGEPLTNDTAIYYTNKATVLSFRKENSLYQACPSADCNKKVIDQANGTYRCEKCQTEYPNFKWRMILSANLMDHSQNIWATFFQDQAEMMLGKTADELGHVRAESESAYELAFLEANYKSYIFKLRAKVESYNDEMRLKTVGLEATPINYAEYNKKLIEEIETLIAQ